MNKTSKKIGVVIGSLLSCSLALASSDDTSTAISQTQYTPSDVAAIQTIVRDYLISHPQVLAEASAALQQQQAAQKQQLAMAAVTQNKQQLFNDSNTPVIGNSNGSLILVEFFDYQCGYCKRMTPVIDTLLKNNKNLKVVLKERPIFGGTSTTAAEAALAVYQLDPKQYEAFHKAIISKKGKLTKEEIMAAASELNINTSKLEKIMNSKQVQDELQQTDALSTALGFSGTPAFVLANGSLTKFEVIGGASSAEVLQQKLNDLQS
jgi:protein-disulfide isomerase